MWQPITNERKACDAVARILEGRLHSKRTNPRCPEKDRSGPPVDYAFELGNRQYAIEHTIIEAFHRQIHTGVDFSALIEPIERELDGRMPQDGLYRLAFPIDPCAGVKRRNLPIVQKAVIQWVHEQAQELDAEALAAKHVQRRNVGCRDGTPAGVPFRLLLWREDAIIPAVSGRLFIARVAPGNVEDLRLERLNKTFKDKCPKLAACKRKGAVSILLLENMDIALTNHALIGETVARLVGKQADRPDEVFLIDTTIQEEWTVWSILRANILWPDEEKEDRYFQFSPTSLDDA